MHQKFIIQPNNSLSRWGWVGFFCSIALVLVLITIRLAYLGFWPMIPFTVIDIIAVGGAFFFVYRRSNIVEQVIISDDNLEIRHLEVTKHKSWDFPLYWVSIDLQNETHPWYPNRLVIGSHGEWIEIANFLTNDERSSLADALKKSVISTRNRQTAGN